MAMEVVCGNCQGRLLVEHTGVVVACPHCGAHLQIGDPAPPVAQVPPPIFSPPVPQPAPAPVPPEVPAAAIPPVPPAPQLAPAPFVQPAPPPIAPPIAPFSISFEPTTQPEPVFPEINLTSSPSVAAVAAVAAAAADTAIETAPSVDVTPQPVAQLSWEPPQSIAPPAGQTASDSWMPQINLTMPPATVESPPPVQPVQPVQPVTPVTPVPAPIVVPEITATLAPVMPVVDASPSTVNLSPAAPAGVPAQQTDIWNPTTAENSRGAEPAISFPSFPGAEPSFANFENFSVTQPAATAIVTTPAPAVDVTPDMAPALPAAPVSHAPPAIVTSNARREATVPRVYFVIVASYASAVTLALLYFWSRGSTSTLDLPDVRPAIKNGQFGLTLIEETPLPNAYRLKLGESKRYGNLLVTPLKVTRGPLEFVHFGDDKQTKPPTASPVLKLWVKFENVSADQTFPVLDERLLYQRLPDRKNVIQDRMNNYVCLQSERKRMGKRVPVYTFPINGDWLLKDQRLDTPLRPQDEWKTYIPSNDEDLSGLQGPLCWRVHFRKGYNPQSKWGVTTLIEVEFDSQEIQADS